MNTRVQALHLPTEQLVEVIQDGEDLAFVRFPNGKCIWVECDVLDFEDLVDGATAAALDDDWGPENDDTLGFDEPFDFDDGIEYEIDSGDHYDMEYDR